MSYKFSLFFALLIANSTTWAALDCELSYRGPVDNQKFQELSVKLLPIKQVQSYQILSAELQGQAAYVNFDNKNSEIQLQMINSTNDKEGIVNSGEVSPRRPIRLSLITESTAHILSCQLKP